MMFTCKTIWIDDEKRAWIVDPESGTVVEIKKIELPKEEKSRD